MKKIFLSLLFFFLVHGAQAAELEIATCHGQSPRVAKLLVQLLVNKDGKFIGRYAFGKDDLYSPSWVNFGEITTPPVSLPKLIDQANRFRDTGIDPTKVKKFQNVFIDGNGRWDLELWKLMDETGRTIGWMAYAYGQPIGCYP
jgi:hypothetical protein